MGTGSLVRMICSVPLQNVKQQYSLFRFCFILACSFRLESKTFTYWNNSSRSETASGNSPDLMIITEGNVSRTDLHKNWWRQPPSWAWRCVVSRGGVAVCLAGSTTLSPSSDGRANHRCARSARTLTSGTRTRGEALLPAWTVGLRVTQICLLLFFPWTYIGPWFFQSRP